MNLWFRTSEAICAWSCKFLLISNIIWFYCLVILMNIYKIRLNLQACVWYASESFKSCDCQKHDMKYSTFHTIGRYILGRFGWCYWNLSEHADIQWLFVGRGCLSPSAQCLVFVLSTVCSEKLLFTAIFMSVTLHIALNIWHNYPVVSLNTMYMSLLRIKAKADTYFSILNVSKCCVNSSAENSRAMLN